MFKLISCMSSDELRNEGEIFKSDGIWWEVTSVNDTYQIGQYEDGSKEYRMASEHSKSINWLMAMYKIWRRRNV